MRTARKTANPNEPSGIFITRVRLLLLLCAWSDLCPVQAALPGGVVAWGNNDWGQTALPAAAQGGVTAIAAGYGHAVALKEDGSVVVWGDDRQGQATVPVEALSGVQAIAAGTAHTVALKQDGSVIAWGGNSFGQATVPLTAQGGVKAIAAGYGHTVVLKENGAVVAWGDNSHGQTTVPPLAQSGVREVAAGYWHTLALKEDGSVVAWGNNSYGQATVPLAAMSGVTAISAGYRHSLALKTDGSLIAWGDNTYGQSTILVAAETGVKAIAAGLRHTVILKEDGSVLAWGDGSSGQTVVPPAAQSGVMAIAAGSSCTLALTIPTAPIINVQPMSQVVALGETVTFTVTAAGSALEFQWLFEGTNIPGATLPFLTLKGVLPEHAGDYSVVISNALGVVTSDVATLEVKATLPTAEIRLAYGHTPTVVGSALQLWASVSGAPYPSVQWQFNRANLEGQTNYYLDFKEVQITNSGNYTIIASNILGVVTSAVAVVTVVESAPVLASFASALPPLMVGSFQWLNAYLTLSEPATLQWRFQGTNIAGATNFWLYLTPLQANDAGEYDVVATTTSGSYTSPPIALTVFYGPPRDAAPAFTLGSSRAFVGTDVSLRATYYGSPSVIQWRWNGADLAGETNEYLALLAVTTNQVGQYSFSASNVAGAVTSSVVSLSVNYQAPVLSTSPSSESVVEGVTTRLWAYAPAGPPAVYFLEKDGTNVPMPYTFDNWSSENSGGFTLLDTTCADAGTYRVIASNYLGSVTSAVATLTVTLAGPLDRWTQRNPLPQSYPLYAVARGADQLVAVGERGTIITSPDGSNWSLQRRRADVTLTGVAYGSGLFVAVGYGGTILSSSEGTNWAYRYTAGGLYLNDVTYADGRFVAVGTAPGFTTLVMHSTNGLDWVRVPLNGFYAERCVAYANGLFVAAGYSSILVSGDGMDWMLVRTVALAIEDLTYANGQFVAVGDDGSMLASADGWSWLPRSALTNRRLLGVAYGAGRFTAVGARGTMLASTDAVTWSIVSAGTPDRLETIHFSGGVFVAAGENGTIITSSTGTNWTKQNLGTTRDLDGMDISNGTVVVVGKAGTILTSTDGAHYWTQDAGTTNDLHGLTWGGGIWVAVGEPGVVLTSSNAVQWVSHSTDTTNSLKGAVFASGQWIVVGTQGTILRSTDGVQWQTITTSPPFDLNDVAYGNGVFLVAADGFGNRNGSVFSSADGVTWYRVNYDPSKNLRSVVFENGMFLFTANDGFVFATEKGLAGSFRTFAAPPSVFFSNLRALTRAGGFWTLVGNRGTFFTSPDGVSWTLRATRTFENLHQVGYVDGRLIVIGNRGTILQSEPFVTELGMPSWVGGEGLLLPFRAVLNHAYQVQATTDLLNWTSLVTFTNLAERGVFTDTNALQYERRFYRLAEP